MLADETKQLIQSSYSQFLKEKQLSARYGQKLMIAAIARSLGSIELDEQDQRKQGQHVCVVEAGTGTGKTVAYLLAAIPIAQALGKKVVIATATVALQEQIILKDLPEVRRASGLKFEYGIAKGRGRYLCLSKLDRILNEDADFLLPVVELDAQGEGSFNRALYQEMMNELASEQWDGDRDSWPQELEANDWQRVTTDHRQCSGRRCSYVRQCAFFKARDTLADMDVIVANHDLVLADLALGGGAILPTPSDTIYIFDEGHHLPGKALSHFSCHTRIVATSRWLGQTEGQWKAFVEPLSDAIGFVQLAIPAEKLFKTARQLVDSVQPAIAAFMPQMDRSQPTVRYRFAQGEIPASLEASAQALAESFLELFNLLEKLSREVDKMLEDEHAPVPRVDLESAYTHLGAWCARAEANLELWQSFAETKANPAWPVARWITLIEHGDTVDFELVSSPVLASSTLERHLWDTCCGAIVTSATLTALNSFDRFRQSAGTPDEALYEVVPSPFDFAQRAVLRVPKSAVDGNQVESHTASIVRLLPQIASLEDAVLVLFSSRRQMLDVFEELDEQWREHILMQGVDTKQTLLSKHKARIDAGQGSILFGLASFAEGVDLPGRYCEHVVIAKIPFAVPDDPIEAALAEWIEARGGNAFMQMTVPDAAVKLVQACGRLLRSETDSGTITLLDRRIISKRYGRLILDALPPFRREL